MLLTKISQCKRIYGYITSIVCTNNTVSSLEREKFALSLLSFSCSSFPIDELIRRFMESQTQQYPNNNINHHQHRSYGGRGSSSTSTSTATMEMARQPLQQHSDNDRSSGELRALDCNLTSLCDHIQMEGFNNGSFSDVVVQAMGATYHLHRLILSRSSYFRLQLSLVFFFQFYPLLITLTLCFLCN